MRVLLVDDHPAVLLGLGALLGAADDIQVVGEATCGEEGLCLTEELRPDLVILDLQMSRGPGGSETCRRLKALASPPRVLIYTGHSSSDHVTQAVLAGADGYFHKGANVANLAGAARRVRAGERVWVLDVGPDEGYLKKNLEDARLTPKESEVFALVLKRYTNAEIAQELFIGLPTAKSHLTSILRKLGARRRGDLVRGSFAPGRSSSY